MSTPNRKTLTEMATGSITPIVAFQLGLLMRSKAKGSDIYFAIKGEDDVSLPKAVYELVRRDLLRFNPELTTQHSIVMTLTSKGRALLDRGK